MFTKACLFVAPLLALPLCSFGASNPNEMSLLCHFQMKSAGIQKVVSDLVENRESSLYSLIVVKEKSSMKDGATIVVQLIDNGKTLNPLQIQLYDQNHLVASVSGKKEFLTLTTYRDGAPEAEVTCGFQK